MCKMLTTVASVMGIAFASTSIAPSAHAQFMLPPEPAPLPIPAARVPPVLLGSWHSVILKVNSGTVLIEELQNAFPAASFIVVNNGKATVAQAGEKLSVSGNGTTTVIANGRLLLSFTQASGTYTVYSDDVPLARTPTVAFDGTGQFGQFGNELALLGDGKFTVADWSELESYDHTNVTTTRVGRIIAEDHSSVDVNGCGTASAVNSAHLRETNCGFVSAKDSAVVESDKPFEVEKNGNAVVRLLK